MLEIRKLRQRRKIGAASVEDLQILQLFAGGQRRRVAPVIDGEDRDLEIRHVLDKRDVVNDVVTEVKIPDLGAVLQDLAFIPRQVVALDGGEDARLVCTDRVSSEVHTPDDSAFGERVPDLGISHIFQTAAFHLHHRTVGHVRQRLAQRLSVVRDGNTVEVHRLVRGVELLTVETEAVIHRRMCRQVLQLSNRLPRHAIGRELYRLQFRHLLQDREQFLDLRRSERGEIQFTVRGAEVHLPHPHEFSAVVVFPNDLHRSRFCRLLRGLCFLGPGLRSRVQTAEYAEQEQREHFPSSLLQESLSLPVPEKRGVSMRRLYRAH